MCTSISQKYAMQAFLQQGVMYIVQSQRDIFHTGQQNKGREVHRQQGMRWM